MIYSTIYVKRKLYMVSENTYNLGLDLFDYWLSAMIDTKINISTSQFSKDDI